MWSMNGEELGPSIKRCDEWLECKETMPARACLLLDVKHTLVFFFLYNLWRLKVKFIYCAAVKSIMVKYFLLMCFWEGIPLKLFFGLLFSTFLEKMPSFCFKAFEVRWYNAAFLGRRKNKNAVVFDEMHDVLNHNFLYSMVHCFDDFDLCLKSLNNFFRMFF